MSETKLTAADVAHLKAGEPAVLRYEGGMEVRSTALYESRSGTLYASSATGPVVRSSNGKPFFALTEVVEPKPPAPAPTWPVGTRLTDGEACAIKTADGSHWPWLVYNKAGAYDTGEWLKDDEVAEWSLVDDAETVDLRAERDRLAAHVDELTQRLADAGRVNTAVDADTIARELVDAGFVEVSDWNGATQVIREHLPAATRPALPEGHVAVDMSWIPTRTLIKWSNDLLLNVSGWRLSGPARAELARRAEAGEDS